MSKNLTNQVFIKVTSLSVNNITINAPENVTYTLTLPTNTGTSGQYLTTNGGGGLNWSSSLPTSSTGTNLTLSGTLTAATLNVTGLNASQIVATDASKNLVSISTGTNDQVLTVVSGTPSWSVVPGGSLYIHSTTSQVIDTSTFTAVSFASPVTSTQGSPGITSSGGTFINNAIPKTVLIIFTSAFESNAVGVRMAIIKVNGTDISYTRSATCSNTNTDAQTTCTVRLPANGVISFTAWQNSGVALNAIVGPAVGIRASVSVLQF